MATDIISYAEQKAAEQGIDPEVVRSILMKESSGRAGVKGKEITNPNSPHFGDRAQGAMQVMPATLEDMKKRGVLPADFEMNTPQAEVDAGIAYLKTLQNQFGNDPAKLVAGYIGGPGAVKKATNPDGTLDTSKLPVSKDDNAQTYTASVLAAMGKADPILLTKTKIESAGTAQNETIDNSVAILQSTQDMLRNLGALQAEQLAVKQQQATQVAAMNNTDPLNANSTYAQINKEIVQEAGALKDLYQKNEEFARTGGFLGNLYTRLYGNPYVQKIQQKVKRVQDLTAASHKIHQVNTEQLSEAALLNTEAQQEATEIAQNVAANELELQIQKLKAQQAGLPLDKAKELASLQSQQQQEYLNDLRIQEAEQKLAGMQSPFSSEGIKKAKSEKVAKAIVEYDLAITPDAAMRKPELLSRLENLAATGAPGVTTIDSIKSWQVLGRPTLEQQSIYGYMEDNFKRKYKDKEKLESENPAKLQAYALEIAKRDAEGEADDVSRPKNMYGMSPPKSYIYKMEDKGLAQAIQMAPFAENYTSPRNVALYLNETYRELPAPERANKVTEYFKTVVDANNERRKYTQINLPPQKGMPIRVEESGGFFAFNSKEYKWDLTNPDDVTKYLVWLDKNQQAEKAKLQQPITQISQRRGVFLGD